MYVGNFEVMYVGKFEKLLISITIRQKIHLNWLCVLHITCYMFRSQNNFSYYMQHLLEN